jgi:molybdopterin synthase sulfur carrier subunit
MPTVRIPPILRPEAGNNRHVEANGGTVREVLESLVAEYPSLRGRIFEGDDLPQFLNVFIDGTDVRLQEGLETPVPAGATVVLLPAVAGGLS